MRTASVSVLSLSRGLFPHNKRVAIARDCTRADEKPRTYQFLSFSTSLTSYSWIPHRHLSLSAQPRAFPLSLSRLISLISPCWSDEAPIIPLHLTDPPAKKVMAYSSTDMDYPFFETSPASPDRNPAKEVMAYPSSTSETSPVCTTKKPLQKCRKLKRHRLEGSLEQDEQLLEMSPEAPE